MTETPNTATPVAEVAPAAARPPDRPPIPRPHRSFVTGLTIALCVAILGGYTALAYSQRELGPEQRDEIPSGMRSTPGGYRTYSYWHSGYHGGK